MHTPRRLARTAVLIIAAATTALGGLAVTAGTAGASIACQTVTGSNAGYCGQEVDAAGDAWDVRYGSAQTNNEVIAYPVSATDKAVDFIAMPNSDGSDSRTFEYAPGGKPSGKCISDTMGGVPGGYYDGLYLRPCNGLKWQLFTGVNTYDTLATQWTNLASGKVVQDNGPRAEMTDWAPANTTPANSLFGWDNPAPASG